VDRVRIFKDTVGYSASAVIAQGLGLAAGFWVARLLAPADFGLWNAASLVLVYGAYVDFGVLSAMGRDLPFYLGQGDAQKVAVLEGAARWATVTGALAVAVVVAFGSFLLTRAPLARFGFCAMALVLVLQQVYTYHRTVLRAYNQFNELSRQQLLLAIFNAGLAVAGVVAFGLAGRFAAAILAQGAILAFALVRSPWRPVPKVSAADVRWLVRVGLPITLSGSIL
jgi:O-antigen/teichoic acid export membrane protein